MTDSASLVPHNCSRPPACRNTGEPCCRRSNWTRPRKDSSHSYPSYRLTSINTSLSTSARIPYRSDREVSIEQRTTQGMVHICLVTGQTKPCAETRHSRWWSPDELTRLDIERNDRCDMLPCRLGAARPSRTQGCRGSRSRFGCYTARDIQSMARRNGWGHPSTNEQSRDRSVARSDAEGRLHPLNDREVTTKSERFEAGIRRHLTAQPIIEGTRSRGKNAQ